MIAERRGILLARSEAVELDRLLEIAAATIPIEWRFASFRYALNVELLKHDELRKARLTPEREEEGR